MGNKTGTKSTTFSWTCKYQDRWYTEKKINHEDKWFFSLIQ